MTGKKATFINIVGGGTKEVPLSKLTAAACARPVYAGPVEASVLGNLSVQAIAHGEIANVKEAREVIANSFEINMYEPGEIGTKDMWDDGYERYLKLIEK